MKIRSAWILVMGALNWVPPLLATNDPDVAADQQVSVTPVRTQVGISPQLFEVSLDEPLATHAYRLHNLGQRDVRATVRVIHWTLDESGEMVELPTSDESIDRWLVVNPMHVDLPAGETRAVRFSFRLARPMPPGEHRAALVFEEVPGERGERDGGTLSLSTRFRITSAIYASTGEVVRGGEIESLALSARELLVVARGEGNGHARFSAHYVIRREGSEDTVAEGDLARVPVLPDLRRPVRTTLPDGVELPRGRYRVQIDGQLGTSPVRLERVVTVAQGK